ncbi:hypothetical protein M0811_08161 [Anaeramoeba ignava]|uniref:Uncharacterized protein n=1 Tax=Anaeramoeba ignava TaxID=1746090 RepID=A0A9Q0RBU5_ANAIG|nr:hypothetical protein M0811_08161 [Anaeramoeba ignava]
MFSKWKKPNLFKKIFGKSTQQNNWFSFKKEKFQKENNLEIVLSDLCLVYENNEWKINQNQNQNQNQIQIQIQNQNEIENHKKIIKSLENQIVLLNLKIEILIDLLIREKISKENQNQKENQKEN